MPEHLRLGLQLAYSETGGENRLFMEKLAADWSRRRRASNIARPDLPGCCRPNPGRHISGDTAPGAVGLAAEAAVSVVNAHFVPLRKMAISFACRQHSHRQRAGWLSRSYFSSQMLEFAAEQSARALAGGLELAAPVEGATAAPVYLKKNLAAVPLALAVMLPPDARVLSAAFQGEYFLLAFSTFMEAADLEPLLTGNLVHEMNLEVAADWVNYAGARRKATFALRRTGFSG